jgi:hypothetical protein
MGFDEFGGSMIRIYLTAEVGMKLPMNTFLVCVQTSSGNPILGKIQAHKNMAGRTFVPVYGSNDYMTEWTVCNWDAYYIPTEAEAMLFMLENA